MAKDYTGQQLADLWVKIGGAKDKAVVMAAIALAESGGNPNAISRTDDYGLWQINQINFGTYRVNGYTVLNPTTNANVAYAMSDNGSNVGPWCTAWDHPVGNCGHHLSAIQHGSPAYERLIELELQNVTPSGTAKSTGISGGPHGSADLADGWKRFQQWGHSWVKTEAGYVAQHLAADQQHRKLL